MMRRLLGHEDIDPLHVDINSQDSVVRPFWNWRSISIEEDSLGPHNSTRDNNCYSFKAIP